MLKKIGLTALGTTTASAGGLYSYIYYNAEELKKDHSKCMRAFMRTSRFGFLGAKMLLLYKVNSQKTEIFNLGLVRMGHPGGKTRKSCRYDA
jgi:hypothetical protein